MSFGSSRLWPVLGPLCGALVVLVSSTAHAAVPAPRAVVVDTGAAMQGAPITAAMSAARTLLTGAGGAPVALITAGDQTSLVLPATSDSHAVDDALAHLPTTGGTAHLLDATLAAVKAAAGAGASDGVVVVISTGQDAGSQATIAQVRSAARDAHIAIDALGTVPTSLAQLVSSTGGKAFPITSVSQLGAAARRLQADLPAAASGGTTVDVGPRSGSSASGSGGGGGVSIVPLLGGLLLAFISLRLILARRAQRPRAAAVLVNSWIGEGAGGTGAAPDLAPTDETLVPGSRGGARWRALAITLEQADMSLTPEKLVLRTAAWAVGVAVVAWVIAGILGALVAAIMVPLAVRAHLKRCVRKRRAAFGEQLADTVQSIAGAMRAGHGLSSAFSMISEDSAEPMATELRRVVGAERLGVPLDEALQEVIRRTGNRDLEQLALVAVLQREVGGNAAEALDQITDTVRHREELRRLVSTLTAQGRLSRWILTALPVGVAGILTVVGGRYMRPMFHTSTGIVLIVGCAMMIVIGSLWIRKIVEIEV